jgi:Domain of unknown function (DUF4337)
VEQEFEVESRVESDEDASRLEGPRWLIPAIAVTTAALAVCAALSSLLGSRAAHHSLSELNQAAIDQNLASDQWTFYQAEGLKRHIFQVQRDALAVQNASGSAQQVATYDAEIKRYAAEQGKIRKEAETRERERDEAKSAAQRFDERYQRLSLAVASFQIAIVVSSVAAIVRRVALWCVGVAAGVVGLFLLVQEFIPLAAGRA